MPQIINTNIGSLNSQRHLNNTQSALSTALERLSSGKRINSAKDDAAGLGISARMTSQINGMNQAIRNARDGISLAQTAEGALSKSEEMLQRVRTLAVQSSNASNSPADRQSLQQEVNELVAELDRFAQTTTFNGKALLNGTMGTANFQVGAEAGELISFGGSNFRTNMYGNYASLNAGPKIKAAAGTATGALHATWLASGNAGHDNNVTADKLTITGYAGVATVNVAAKDSAASVAAAINAKLGETGVKAMAQTSAGMTLAPNAAGGTFELQIISNNNAVDASKNYTDVATVSFSLSKVPATGSDYAEAISAINKVSGKTGVTAEWDETNSCVKLTNASGEDIKILNNSVASAASNGGGDVKLDTYKTDGKLDGTAASTLAGNDTLGSRVFAAVAGTVNLNSSYSFSVVDSAPTTGLGFNTAILQKVAEIDISTFEGAQKAINIAAGAIDAVNREMGNYGALQNRLQYTIENLEVASENTSNARSRIQDADYAQETAALSRASILQQAGTAMLAQANQMPQNVLSLIG